jgi:hypothetical protein
MRVRAWPYAEGLMMPASGTILWLKLPWQQDDVQQPVSAIQNPLVDFVERYSNILYPALALAVLLVLVIGIMHAWRSQDMDGLAKAEFKREIILELRRNTFGLSAEMLARALELELLKTVRLLEEMKEDGVVFPETDREQSTRWRLKGLST